ncbi:MAG: VOC family protein [Bacillota bacterium]
MSEKMRSDIPYVLGLNRVKRAYTGGKLLDEWQGLDNPSDGNFPEEFLISTIEVTNENKEVGEGMSKTQLDDGTEVFLKNIIDSDLVGFLGEDYAYKKDICVSARVGDATVRLVLQCHPDTKFAKTHLDYPNGKAEAWYIVETREVNGEQPHLFVGFKKGVTKEKWRELFLAQDVPGMLDCMHKVEVEKGKSYFVEAGMPHCLGAGSVFLEIHEPCDYTFRLEKDYLPNRKFSDNELHYGLGNDLLMDAFHYDTFTEEEIREKCFLKPQSLFATKDAKGEIIVSYEDAKRFKVEKFEFTDELELPEFYGHRIAITVTNPCEFIAGDFSVTAPQGRGVFLPANAKKLKVKNVGEKSMILLCYPPDIKVNAKETFKDPIQIGILVKDLDSYLKKLDEVFGMGPFRIAEYPPQGATPYREYRGKDGNFTAKFCFYHLGNIELELIQPLSGDNIWSDHIEKHGEGLHHLKFLVPEHEPVQKYLNENGYVISQQGQGVGPNAHRVWTFYETYQDIGFDLEIMND